MHGFSVIPDLSFGLARIGCLFGPGLNDLPYFLGESTIPLGLSGEPSLDHLNMIYCEYIGWTAMPHHYPQ